ncbi:unnamed protein product [Clavelina lepadiformis]|uniref:EF-hand domain-containing protein n=1 Tax=Clavelina lepadiformis TaxID=159417 RepID=A0ABP0G176_CLALP
MLIYKFLLLLFCVWSSSCAPAPTKLSPPPVDNVDEIEKAEQAADAMNTGLYYDQYLQKVIKLLESNEDFKKKMENANFDDIRAGKLSPEVNNMPWDIRDQLNSLKKEEMTRLRKILHAKTELEKGRKVKKSAYLTQIANHLDHENPHSFEAADLTNLIRAATTDLENFDKNRHEEFKNYEMKKELLREEKMQMLDEREREKAEKEFLEKRKQLAENSQMHHPGSKAQFEEAWKEDDGLREQDFNSKTFFSLHDLNSDGHLDSMELEALFEKDLKNAYNSSDPDYDYMQMEEERMRMRKHVMEEVDKDGDGVISLAEFLKYTELSEFANPDEDSYKTIDQLLAEHLLYTQDELSKYRGKIAEQEEEIKQKLELLKAEAKNLGGMRRELGDERREAAKDGIQEEEKLQLEVKEEVIKQQEEKLQAIHKDLQEQSKEVLQMKQQVQKHEAGEKVADSIKTKLDTLPPGEEKEKAIAQAHKELESLKTAQTGVNQQSDKANNNQKEIGNDPNQELQNSEGQTL